jgi:glycosyltransferase involved in cell wall biosynthesis
MPFYSIVIASFNDERNLRNISSSLNSQSFLDYEVLISDGGSTDGTLEYISNGGFRNLTWFKSCKDNGIYDALNIALEHVSGKWVLVVGSDDQLADSNSLLCAHEALISLSKEVGFAYADLLILRNSKITLKKYPDYEEFNKKYGGGAFIHHQTAFIKSEFILKVCKFSNLYKIHADYNLMLGISNLTEVKKIEGAFVIFNANGFSSKFSNLLLSFSEIYKIRSMHGLVAMPSRLLITYLALFVRRIFPFLKL